jgi:hypothetical protein
VDMCINAIETVIGQGGFRKRRDIQRMVSRLTPLSSRRYPLTLWVPDRESYRSQIAKFLTFKGFFSWIYVDITNDSSGVQASRRQICGMR